LRPHHFIVRIVVPFVIALLGAACAHAPPPPLHSTRLVVARTPSGGYVPYVRAKVAGETVSLLLDGSGPQLPSGFVRAAPQAADAGIARER
jgi:hypothetical protein